MSAAIKADQSSFQSYRSGVHGNKRLDSNSLLDCVVFGRVTGVACARYVLSDNTKAESCSTGVDEMREMASTIKAEVRTDLNATRKRLHQTASDFIGCNTLTSQVGSYRSIFRARAKSHTSYRKQQHAETNVSMACAKFLNAMKANRTLLCARGKSDCRRRRSRSDMHAFCQGNIEQVVGRHGRSV